MAPSSDIPPPATGFEAAASGAASNRLRRSRRLPARRSLGQGYSGFVSAMKFLLPAGALGLIAMVALWPHFSAEDIGFRIGFAALKNTETGDPSMINPRYFGSDKHNRSYSVTADLARKTEEDQQVFELEMPKADILLQDGTWLVLTADSGLYGSLEQTLDLSGSVNLFHDSGYEFSTEKAAIDLETGLASGTAPVAGQGPFGNLNAQGFRLLDKGKIIYFTGKAKLVLYPGVGDGR